MEQQRTSRSWTRVPKGKAKGPSSQSQTLGRILVLRDVHINNSVGAGLTSAKKNCRRSITSRRRLTSILLIKTAIAVRGIVGIVTVGDIRLLMNKLLLVVSGYFDSMMRHS